MSSEPLHLAWVGHDAAKLAVTRWHYSRSVPAGRAMHLGVWEDGAFRGVVTFSRGSTPNIGTPYGLDQTHVCELTRVALDKHKTPVSRIVAIGLKLLRKACPDLRLVVSYAAGEQKHHGGIYQAGGWVYEGPMDSYALIVNGRVTHARTLNSKFKSASLDWIRANVDPKAEKVKGLVRHKYLMPLDAAMRAQIAPLSKPYPKRA